MVEAHPAIEVGAPIVIDGTLRDTERTQLGGIEAEPLEIDPPGQYLTLLAKPWIR